MICKWCEKPVTPGTVHSPTEPNCDCVVRPFGDVPTPFGVAVPPISVRYEPHMWTVRKDDIYAAIDAIKAGLEHTQSALAEHDATLGRTTRKNRVWAEQIEEDIRQMESTLKNLRQYHD